MLLEQYYQIGPEPFIESQTLVSLTIAKPLKGSHPNHKHHLPWVLWVF